MKYSFLFSLIAIAVPFDVLADTVIVDFTAPAAATGNPDTGPGLSGPVLQDIDFGGGRTADVTLSTGGNALDYISVGVGTAAGGQGNRIGDTPGEVITIVFSDFQGGLSAGDIVLEGLVASSVGTSGIFTFSADDVLNVNGVNLAGDDVGDGVAPDLSYGSLDDFIFQRADTPVALNGSDALVLDLQGEAGDGFRLQGLELEVNAGGGTGGNDAQISIDFGANAPASTNWNQFSANGSTTTVSNLIRRADGASTGIGITVSGITGNGLNHLQGAGSADSTIYFDHIFAQNESPDDTLTVTLFGLDDSLTYGLSGGFVRDATTFEHEWSVGSDVRSNSLSGGVVDGYETFSNLSPSGGEITFTISDLLTADDWSSIAELTLTIPEGGLVIRPFADGQNLRTEPDTAIDITLTGSDSEGSSLTYSLVDSPSDGSLTGTAPDLTYNPDSGFQGTDSFTFIVNNGEEDSEPATVTIRVQEKGPNFLLILTDDQGYNDLGCYGSPHILTPRIDQMAAEGIRFTDGYVPMPVCGPCRAGILTGSYPIRIAEPNNEKNHHTEPHADEIFITELLKPAGYTSALIGKWHSSGEGSAATTLSDTRGPVAQGFDYFYGTPSHNGIRAVDTGTNVRTSILRSSASGTTVVDADLDQSEADEMILNYTNEATQFIEDAHNADQPFFLKLAHNMPHVSLGARQSFRDSAAARGLDVYTAVMEELDWSAGVVLDKLDELGIAEDTFVIFSSDNGPWTQANLEGYYGSAFPLRGSKMRSLEGGARVPYIVRWPETIPAGLVSEEVVTLMDLFPTFLDYAGVEMPVGLTIDGKTIRPLIEGSDPTSPHDYYYYYTYTKLCALRDERWKLVLPRRNNPNAVNWMRFWAQWQDRVDELELYDLDNDPQEAVNLASQYPAEVQRLLLQAQVAQAELGDADQIGSGARFFDAGTQRPEIALYQNANNQPFVDEPLTGLPTYEKTSLSGALVSYDEPADFTNVQVVWAYEDQGHEDATTWAAASGGGSASLGAISASESISYEIANLNPFRQTIFRFILTNANGTFWSIAAPIQPEREELIAYHCGFDFGDGSSTPGDGVDPSFNLITSNGLLPSVTTITGEVLPGVSAETTGISGEVTGSGVGFGFEAYANYLSTSFSDLTVNDGVEGNSSLQVVLSGLDDSYVYDVQVVAMPEVSTNAGDLTIAAGDLSQVRTYASFRAYVNTDPAPFTNSDLVLSSPFASQPSLIPAEFENLTTDGAGKLVITLTDEGSVPLNAIYLTAKKAQGLVDCDGGDHFRFWLNHVLTGRQPGIWSSSNLEGWSPLTPALQFTDSVPQPLSVPIDETEPRMFYQIQESGLD